MKQILGIIILSWLLFGCSFWETSGRLLDIGEGTPIEAHPYAYDLVMSNPLNLAVVKDKLLLFQHTGEDAVLMMDRESGKPVGCWGVAGGTAYQAQDKEMMSDLALANVEALANGEGGSECRWKRVKDEYGCTVHYCIQGGDGSVCSCGSVA